MKMAAIYGAEKGIGMLHLVGALLVTQFVGAPFSILFGKLSLRLGGKTAITIGLVWYGLISFGAFFLENAWHFWVLAIAVEWSREGCRLSAAALTGKWCLGQGPVNSSPFTTSSANFQGLPDLHFLQS